MRHSDLHFLFINYEIFMIQSVPGPMCKYYFDSGTEIIVVIINTYICTYTSFQHFNFAGTASQVSRPVYLF